MTRRLQHYDVAEWRPWVLAAAVGVVISGVGMLCQIVQLVVSIRDRVALRDETGDPWDGRSLEWATASPPPAFISPFCPTSRGGAILGDEAARHRDAASRRGWRISGDHMPKNSATGFMTAFLRRSPALG